jgi:hypothetical protein
VDLGDPVADWLPLDAERLGEVLAQGRLVEVARGARVGVQRMPVERRRPTLCDGRLGDDRVGVQLPVPGAGAAVAKGRDAQPAATQDAMAAALAACPRGVAFDVAQRLLDGVVVGVAHDR